MKKILFLLSIVAASGFVAAPAFSSQYAVQLEASKSPNLNRFESLKVYGQLYTVDANNGYTRTRIGPYENKNKALEVLKEVHAAGFQDAFIAKQKSEDAISPAAVSKSSNHAGKHNYDIETFDVRTLKEWKMLSAEQQANLVYLDGKLHVKDGNRFTPLGEVVGK